MSTPVDMSFGLLDLNLNLPEELSSSSIEKILSETASDLRLHLEKSPASSHRTVDELMQGLKEDKPIKTPEGRYELYMWGEPDRKEKKTGMTRGRRAVAVYLDPGAVYTTMPVAVTGKTNADAEKFATKFFSAFYIYMARELEKPAR